MDMNTNYLALLPILFRKRFPQKEGLVQKLVFFLRASVAAWYSVRCSFLAGGLDPACETLYISTQNSIPAAGACSFRSL